MTKNNQANRRLSVTMQAEMRPKVQQLQEKLGQSSPAKAIETLADLYLEGKLISSNGEDLEMTKLKGKEEVLQPISEYFALIFQRAGLDIETNMIKTAIGSAAGVTSATNEHFDLPLAIMSQLQAMNDAARNEISDQKIQLFDHLSEINKTLKVIAISTEITRGIAHERQGTL